MDNTASILTLAARKTQDIRLLQVISHLRTAELQKRLQAKKNPFTDKVYNPYPLQEENPLYKELYKEQKGVEAVIRGEDISAAAAIMAVQWSHPELGSGTATGVPITPVNHAEVTHAMANGLKKEKKKRWQPVKLNKNNL